MVYAISKRIFWPIFRLFIKRIDGVDNLPDPPFILAANHSSYIDGPLLMMLVAWHKNTRLYMFATNERFVGLFWNIIFTHFGAIRVNGSLDKGIEKVKQGHAIGIFPEGGRTRTGELQDVTNTGLGVLALKTNVPVVPVRLNTYSWWNLHRVFPTFKKTIEITIGKPKRFTRKYTKTNAKRIIKTIMHEVKKLA